MTNAFELSTVLTGDPVTGMLFRAFKHFTTFQTFRQPRTHGFFAFLVRLIAILPVKQTFAMVALDGGFFKRGKVSTAFLVTSTGNTVLSLAIVVLRRFLVVSAFAVTAKIGTIQEGG